MYKCELRLKGVVEYNMNFYSVHHHNRLQVRIPPCNLYKMPITAEQCMVFRKHWVFTVPSHFKNVVVHFKKVEKDTLPFLVLLRSARFFICLGEYSFSPRFHADVFFVDSRYNLQTV